MARFSGPAFLALVVAALVATASAGGLYGSRGSAVIELNGKNFQQVHDSPRLTPEYEKAATNLKGLVKVGAVNCDEEQALCSTHGVQGFPTIKIFPSEARTTGKRGLSTKSAKDYTGERTARAIVDNALEYLPMWVKKVGSGASAKGVVNIEDFLQTDADLAHVLLFSSKTTTTPLFKALAVDFKNRLVLGEVKHTDKALVERYKVEQFPTLLVVTSDASAEPVRYDGALKHDALSSFLARYAGAAKEGNQGSGSTDSKAESNSNTNKAEEFDPSVPQVKTQDDLERECLQKTNGLCVIAFMDFDAEYERSVRDHEDNLRILRAVKKRAHDAGRALNVLWLDNSEQTKLRESFGLSDFLPSVMALSPTRNVYRPMVAGFDEANLWEFIEETQMGQGRIFRFNHKPTVA